MNTRVPPSSLIIGLAALLVLPIGCDKAAPDKQPQAPASHGLQAARSNEGGVNAAAASLPADLFLDEEPAGAKDVGEVKADAAATGEVVLRGRIGGRVDPFVKGRAVFTLADLRMPTCDQKHGPDGCPTPWDYCCEAKADLLAKTITIQIVGADQRPLALDVQGRHGLVPKAALVVAGKVAQRAEGVLVVDAKRIFVVKDKG